MQTKNKIISVNKSSARSVAHAETLALEIAIRNAGTANYQKNARIPGPQENLNGFSLDNSQMIYMHDDLMEQRVLSIIKEIENALKQEGYDDKPILVATIKALQHVKFTNFLIAKQLMEHNKELYGPLRPLVAGFVTAGIVTRDLVCLLADLSYSLKTIISTLKFLNLPVEAGDFGRFTAREIEQALKQDGNSKAAVKKRKN